MIYSKTLMYSGTIPGGTYAPVGLGGNRVLAGSDIVIVAAAITGFVYDSVTFQSRNARAYVRMLLNDFSNVGVKEDTSIRNQVTGEILQQEDILINDVKVVPLCIAMSQSETFEMEYGVNLIDAAGANDKHFEYSVTLYYEKVEKPFLNAREGLSVRRGLSK